jgi:hypothetical protein
MAAKRAIMTATHLDSMKAKKPDIALAQAAPEPATAARAVDDRKGQTLRLRPDAWKQLKVLAMDEGKTSHDLALEGINLVFEKRGLPPIA